MGRGVADERTHRVLADPLEVVDRQVRALLLARANGVGDLPALGLLAGKIAAGRGGVEDQRGQHDAAQGDQAWQRRMAAVNHNGLRMVAPPRSTTRRAMPRDPR